MKFVRGARNLLCLAGVVAVLAGCSGGNREAGLPDGLPVAQTVNGQAVPQVLLDAVARERQLDLAVPEQREQAIKELTDYILLAQAARRENYFADPLFAAEVEINRLQGVANATIGKFRSGSTIDDSVLKVEYDQQIARAGNLEYDFAQLLFDNEQAALAVADEAIARPFDQVFEAWREKALQARAFARVRLGQLPDPLARAVSGLKAGETSKVPVNTEFGWHVVHVTATTPFAPPEFEQVKESIRSNLLMQLADRRLEKLREEAKIEVNTPVQPAPAESQATEPPVAPAR